MITKSGYGTNRTNNVNSEKTQRYKKLLEEPQKQQVSYTPVNSNKFIKDNFLSPEEIDKRIYTLPDGTTANKQNYTPEEQQLLLSGKYKINPDYDPNKYMSQKILSTAELKSSEQFQKEAYDKANTLGKAQIIAGKVGNTAKDIVGSAGIGAISAAEGLANTGIATVGNIANLVGAKDVANFTTNMLKDDITGELNQRLNTSTQSGYGRYTPSILRIEARDIAQEAARMVTAGAGGTAGFIGSAIGGNTGEAIRERESLGRATAYGTVTGTIEGATEKLFDTFNLLGGGVLDKFVPKNVIAKFATGAIGEGIEEMISESLNPFAKILTYEGETTNPFASGEDFKEYVKNIGVAGWQGFVMGMFMQGVHDVSNAEVRKQYKEEVTKAVNKVKGLTQQQKQVAIDTLVNEANTSNIQPESMEEVINNQNINYSPVNARQVLSQPNINVTEQGTQILPKAEQIKPKVSDKGALIAKINNNRYLNEQEKNSLIAQVQTNPYSKDLENGIQSVLKSVNEQVGLKNINNNFKENKSTYGKYANDTTEYDKSFIENAKNLIPANNSGRRTKEQWLKIADNLGSQISNMGDSEIERLAYRTWIDNKPNNPANLNRQGQKYVKFSLDEWVNSVYESARQARENIEVEGKPLALKPSAIYVTPEGQAMTTETYSDYETGKLKLPTTKTNSVYQAAKNNKVDVKLANRLMDIAEKTNARVEGFYNENPDVEGYYGNGIIHINVNSNKAADTIFAHEFTHHLESTNAWNDVRDAIINSNTLYNMLSEQGINIDEYKQQIRDTYAANGVELKTELDVEKEIVAKFVENNLMKDEKTIVRMINENPSFMQRLKNFWDDLVVRFKGTAEEKELRRIQNIYNKAFAEAQNTINNTNNIKYSILDKDAWEGRQRYIDKRNASNRENAINATEEQLETIEKIARIRHDIHISDDLFNSESSSNQEQSDFLMNINDELEELELPTIDLPISWDLSDLTTDVDVYELGMDYDEAYSEFQSQKEQINNAIEKYLREFDKSHNTNYAPTGMTRYGKETQKGNTQTTETKYSIGAQANTDNQGRKLSQQQQEFFKDSKVRDEEGNLKVMYHFTNDIFNTIDFKKNAQGLFWFTDRKTALESGNISASGLRPGKDIITKEMYVNMINPAGYEEYDKYTIQQLIDRGYDGILFDDGEGTIIGAVFNNSNQIKNVDNTNPTSDPDIRYSIETDKQTSTPKRYLSEHANTLLESGVTLPETRDVIAKMVEQGTLTHERITDKDAQAYAEKYIIENGFEDAVQHWNHLIKSNREMSKEELALGQTIYNNALNNENGPKDIDLIKKMIADLVAEGTTAGRNLQAMSMVKRLTPDGRLYALERSVQKLNQQYRDEIGKKFKDIEIPNDLAEALLKSKGQKEIDANVEKIQQYIADQIPATWKDKLNAWRYLAMLGNTRTHIRNLAGNAVFIPAIEIKNAMALVGEKTLPTAERTKAILTKKDRALLDFAENDFDNNEQTIRGENKFDIASGVQEKRRIFDNKVLETLRKANFAALEKEDAMFLKYHYKRAMARAIKAKGLSLEQLKSGSAEMNSKLSEIRNYAINEAQKATYRDFNALAKWISNNKSRLKRNAAQSKRYKKAGYELVYAGVEGLIPFTKTPANIVKRIVEYSPVNIAKGIVDMNTSVKNGDMSASQAIDELCSGITGTGIVGLGILLASLGFITGGGEDKQKEEQFESLKGNQNYALKIGNKTYTIDWAAPSAVPLFVGVEIFNSLKNSENADVIGSFVKIVDPVFEMSMLQGINSALSAYGSDNAIGKAVSNMFQSYLGQYVPSLFGAVARTVDPVRRTTYADKNKMLPTGLQTFTQKQLQKIPVASTMLPTYKDQFGRDSRTDNLLIRIFSNFLSPGYLAEVKDKPVENELTRIYDKTGETDVLPSYASKSITVDGEKINFTYEQYEKFATTRGDIAYKNLEKLFADPRYKRLSDEEKVSAITKIYTYANDVAKSKVSDYKLTKEKARIERQGNNYYREVLK